MPDTNLRRRRCRRRQASAISVPSVGAGRRSGLSPSSFCRHHTHRLRTSTPPSSSSGRSKSRRSAKVIRRTTSEPILWTVRILPEPSHGELVIKQPMALLPRPHTCSDVLSPPPLSPASWRSDPLDEGMKVVVSVTVEGSPGPVNAMVRLGASVEEAITEVIDKYRREGRSPKLDQAEAASFQLHHSLFSLQSLSKSEKIGEVGGRRFYLRTSNEINSFHFEREDSNLKTGGSEIRLSTDIAPAVGLHQSLLALVIKRLENIGRKTRKLCRVAACISCM